MKAVGPRSPAQRGRSRGLRPNERPATRPTNGTCGLVAVPSGPPVSGTRSQRGPERADRCLIRARCARVRVRVRDRFGACASARRGPIRPGSAAPGRLHARRARTSGLAPGTTCSINIRAHRHLAPKRPFTQMRRRTHPRAPPRRPSRCSHVHHGALLRTQLDKGWLGRCSFRAEVGSGCGTSVTTDCTEATHAWGRAPRPRLAGYVAHRGVGERLRPAYDLWLGKRAFYLHAAHKGWSLARGAHLRERGLAGKDNGCHNEGLSSCLCKGSGHG